MKKFKTIIMCAVIFSVSFLMTGLIMGSGGSVDAVMADESESVKYTLKEYNGFIAVFGGDSEGEPMIETDISTVTLRAVDREKLRNGIKADSYEQILRLLEDFGS